MTSSYAWAPADLVTDTTPIRHSEREFTLDVPEHWDFLMPSGGVLMTAALRAAEITIADAELRLVSATTIFCEPIQSGRVDLTVDVLRAGRSAVQARVHLHGPDHPGLQVLATFARDRAGPDVRGAVMPDVPPPSTCPDLRDAPASHQRQIRFFENVDCRIATGTWSWSPDFVPGPARVARWFRYRRPQRDAAGRFDRLAHAPIADTMPGALSRAIGPGPYRFYAPSLDLTLHVVDDTDREWMLVSAYVRRARAGWAIGETEVWDDQGRLLAFASQAMYVRNLAGEPPTIDATGRG